MKRAIKLSQTATRTALEVWETQHDLDGLLRLQGQINRRIQQLQAILKTAKVSHDDLAHLGLVSMTDEVDDLGTPEPVRATSKGKAGKKSAKPAANSVRAAKRASSAHSSFQLPNEVDAEEFAAFTEK